MKVITTSPFYSPLHLSAGLDPQSSAYTHTLAALPSESEQIHVPNRRQDGLNNKYEDLEDDDYDLRLFVFSPAPKKDEPRLRFHIYGNGVSVVTAEFEMPDTLTPRELEQRSQDITRSAFDKYAPDLKPLLEGIYTKMPRAMMVGGSEIKDITNADICWISRAIIFDKADMKSQTVKTFISEWLSHTARPKDAQALIKGEIDFSMTWLNYAIIEPGTEKRGTLLSALRIAQFFYASQEQLNNNAYHALTASALEKNVRIVEKKLIGARRNMQMLHIMYDMQKSFLNRKKRQLVDDLMAVWDFDILKANGDRMVDASNTRISEITNKRTERSSFFTDLILVGLALVAVIEVSMYLTEYSREVMSRPALAYQDDKASWILSTIAAIDTDQMLVGGAFIILILVCLYVYWKIKR